MANIQASVDEYSTVIGPKVGIAFSVVNRDLRSTWMHLTAMSMIGN